MQMSMQCFQALATETVEAEVATAAAQNGNGKLAASNGNGNGNGNGASANGATIGTNGATTVKVVLPSPPATISSSAASTNGNGNGASANGNGVSTSTAAAAAATAAAAVAAPAAAAAVKQQQEAERIRMLNTIDEEQNAEAAGQLELAAATGGRKQRTAAGTPYKAPGGNWSKFKTYSVWQVRLRGMHGGIWLHTALRILHDHCLLLQNVRVSLCMQVLYACWGLHAYHSSQSDTYLVLSCDSNSNSTLNILLHL
jgi:hypothetical protein